MKEYSTQQLHKLARLYGIETAYRDFKGKLQYAEPQSLLATLRALEAPVENMADIPDALRQSVQERWQKHCEPITVVWGSNYASIEFKLPAIYEKETGKCHLQIENGKTFSWEQKIFSLPVLQSITVEGVKYIIKMLTLNIELPYGYHSFKLVLPGIQCSTLIIAAPQNFYSLQQKHMWGIFSPVYSLYSEHSWGAGDFNDFGSFIDWIGENGGNIAGTLPLLSTFLDKPFNPSPYSPISRLFWNEFYLNIMEIPELAYCPEARELIESEQIQKELNDLQNLPLVDYHRCMAIKRQVLEKLANCCFSSNSARKNLLHKWLEKNPMVQDYARFRAVVELKGANWRNWSKSLRDGIIERQDYNPEIEMYHIYIQWVTYEQFQKLVNKANHNNVNLYLDFPLGVNSDGYDIWRERDSFVLNVSSGAPPDMFFTKGQDWGVIPLHPIRIREQGYGYYIECLKHHLRNASILRMDHVMGLHRLFWIPHGLPADQGIYVHYYPEDFYAILSLESNKNQAVIVGEDLGLVPDYVRKKMKYHNAYNMYVLPFELTKDNKQMLKEPPLHSLNCMNTHDMPPFAAFWPEMNKEERNILIKFLYQQGWLTEYTEDTETIFQACLEFLASSSSQLMLINLEDIWLETKPQNIPGTQDENPNWQRKTHYSIETFKKMPKIHNLLQKIHNSRNTEG
ncbi:MAG: 4-alpha-glucanotransferase [Clostridiales bacterium]|nr:4-alpha-glucanotransferase [Clostridiales bacterium]MCF8021400.1 4-alpha-glucanotransferase [Clostridiales bacterium]